MNTKPHPRMHYRGIGSLISPLQASAPVVQRVADPRSRDALAIIEREYPEQARVLAEALVRLQKTKPIAPAPLPAFASA